MISKIITIHDKQYKTEQEHAAVRCTGCVFIGTDSSGCTANQSAIDICSSEDAIFTEVQPQPALEEEQKYTLKELIDKFAKLNFDTYELEYLLDLEQQEKLKQDQDYSKFLELKEKFKSLS